MRSMRFLFLALFVPLAMALSTATARAAEPVVLTVFGNITQGNRGALDEFADSLLKTNGKEFAKARAFTRADLAALKQETVAADAEGWPEPVKLTGPGLADVMAAAGASGENLAFTALDGYTIEFEPGEMASRQWILAIDMNGKPLDIGGRGPVWLAYDNTNEKATAEEEARWVYAIFAIEAR